MTEHPENYVMSRAEWLAVNRALAGATLAMRFPRDPIQQKQSQERLNRVLAAAMILSNIYDRAAAGARAAG